MWQSLSGPSGLEIVLDDGDEDASNDGDMLCPKSTEGAADAWCGFLRPPACDNLPIIVEQHFASPGTAIEELESFAMGLLTSRPQGPTIHEILSLVENIPRSLKREGAFLCGSSPRSSTRTLSATTQIPSTCRTLANFVARVCPPSFRFNTLLVREGTRDRPHRDLRNAPFPTLILALTPQVSGEGLWIIDRTGQVRIQHLGVWLRGSVLPIFPEPLIIDTRKVLHAGFTLRPLTRRVILVAFCNAHSSRLTPQVRSSLLELGFLAPSREEVAEALRPSLYEPRTFRQLTLKEALTEAPDQDVIVVRDDENRETEMR